MSRPTISVSKALRTLVVADCGPQLVPYDLALKVQQALRLAHSTHEPPDVLLQLQVEPCTSISAFATTAAAVTGTNKTEKGISCLLDLE